MLLTEDTPQPSFEEEMKSLCRQALRNVLSVSADTADATYLVLVFDQERGAVGFDAFFRKGRRFYRSEDLVGTGSTSIQRAQALAVFSSSAASQLGALFTSAGRALPDVIRMSYDLRREEAGLTPQQTSLVYTFGDTPTLAEASQAWRESLDAGSPESIQERLEDLLAA